MARLTPDEEKVVKEIKATLRGYADKFLKKEMPAYEYHNKVWTLMADNHETVVIMALANRSSELYDCILTTTM